MHGDQVAVAAGLQFLSLNGWRAELDPPATAVVVVEALARGQLSPAAAAQWLSPGLRVDGIRSAGTRWAVIITGLGMTCFGLLWLFLPALGYIALGLSGSCLRWRPSCA